MTAFGSVFMPDMTLSKFDGNQWGPIEFVPANSLSFHAGAHGLHYSSSVFEGLKAFKHADGSINFFRMDRNIARLATSSELLSLPVIDTSLTTKMITDITERFGSDIPEPPGSMYIRPTHIGTDPIIGAAASPSKTSYLYILLSPVGDYFTSDAGTLRVLIETEGIRCAPHMGIVKSGGNYASALAPTLKAKQEFKADQILFCPNGDVQETGASNFLLIDGNTLITRALDSTFLHGVTRDSLLTIARDIGMSVEERELSVTELLERAEKPDCEAALSGTAAVLTPVGTLINNGKEHTVGNGKPGTTTLKLRQILNAIQWGKAEDTHGWLTKI